MIVDIAEQISLEEIIRGLLPSEIKRFLLSYANNGHTYITTKDLSWEYLETYYIIDIIPTIEKDRLLRILIRKFSSQIGKLLKVGILERHNNRTFKLKKIGNHSNSCRLVFIDGKFRNLNLQD